MEDHGEARAKVIRPDYEQSLPRVPTHSTIPEKNEGLFVVYRTLKPSPMLEAREHEKSFHAGSSEARDGLCIIVSHAWVEAAKESRESRRLARDSRDFGRSRIDPEREFARRLHSHRCAKPDSPILEHRKPIIGCVCSKIDCRLQLSATRVTPMCKRLIIMFTWITVITISIVCRTKFWSLFECEKQDNTKKSFETGSLYARDRLCHAWVEPTSQRAVALAHKGASVEARVRL